MSRALSFALLVTASLSGAGCKTELGPTAPMGPFDRDVVVMCGTRTSSVGVYTRGGGRLALTLHRPGCRPAGCEGSDVYAPDAWATVRTSGPDVSIDGCDPLSAVGADRLGVTFTPEAGDPEEYDIPLVGDCLMGVSCVSADGG